MKRETISQALSLVDQRYLLEALALEAPGTAQAAPKEGIMKRPKHAAKTARRTILIAAVISAFFAVTAFAIGYSIHQQRQQELRQKMQIDAHQVESYVEYPVPSEGESIGATEADKITVTLLSSSLSGEFVDLYFNVSPVELSLAAPNEDCIYCSVDGEYWHFASGVFLDPDFSYRPGVDTLRPEDVMYDTETKTLTMRSFLWSDEVETGGTAEVRVLLYPEEKEIGRFTIQVPELESRTCLFSQPLRFSSDGMDMTGSVLGVELSPTCMYFIVENEGAELLHYAARGLTWDELTPEEQELYRKSNAAWARAVDRVTRGTLHMADGTDFEVSGCNSGNYENGLTKWFADWPLQTIDINAVTAITIDGTRIELN